MFSDLIHVIGPLALNRRSLLAYATPRSGADNAKRLLTAGRAAHGLCARRQLSDARTHTAPKLERSADRHLKPRVAGRHPQFFGDRS
jgi:hypothetical protein